MAVVPGPHSEMTYLLSSVGAVTGCKMWIRCSGGLQNSLLCFPYWSPPLVCDRVWPLFPSSFSGSDCYASSKVVVIPGSRDAPSGREAIWSQYWIRSE